MNAYKKSLILGTSILALSIFTLPINVNAHGAPEQDPDTHENYNAPVTCYTTDADGDEDQISSTIDLGGGAIETPCDAFAEPEEPCDLNFTTITTYSSSSSSSSSSSGSSSSGGNDSGGDSPSGFDVDGDGQADFNSYSDARDYAEENGLDTSAGGDIDNVNNECSGACDGSTADIGSSSSSSSSSGDSGGDSGGGKVFCTYYFQKGQLSAEDYYSSNYYSLTKLPKAMLHGYHAWAIPYVKHMYKNPDGLAVKIMRPIVLHRAYELAYKMGVRDKPDYIGKLVRLVFEPTCYFIGLFAKERDYSHLYAPKVQELLNAKYKKHMMKKQAQDVVNSYNEFRKSLA